MSGVSNRVVYGIGAAVVVIAGIVIGWNFWRNLPVPASTISAGTPAETVAQPQAKLEPAKPQSTNPEPSKSAADKPQKPQFDVVRVEPSGETVVAGRAAPNAKVTLFATGKPVGQATANAEGQFVILPPTLPPGDHLLSLEADAVASDQTVAVVVPKPGSRDVIVALAEPDKPTRILSDAKPQAGPVAGSAPASSAAPSVTIRTVEAQDGGGFFLSGLAAAGARVRLYLNGAFIAMAETAADGHWSMRIEKGMSPGKYAVRADLVAKDGVGVAARAEVPFDYPGAGAVAAAADKREGTGPSTASASQTSQRAAATQAAAAPSAEKRTGTAGTAQSTIVPELRTARVERGDSLWRISRTVLGQGMRYTQIYDANANQIRNPDLIYPGQVLVVPNPVP
ncbi:nucleoid-associated protein YgaU [Beijerinckia sp. GAS462]|nr:nucleoid-associated protein YgaU [Beijerinckia sp. GAS462]SEC33730.1 Nucleoid-associated protein YgaU, contains BON and LysM domains [Beijerinckia sp. 28-YEA-48]